ncbi:quinolinate synthase NadA [Ferrovum sp. PN-J185]|uniref:quinolinate synthase NadA n=1 Tax=Ferrovum sp. PN-J185 TaxID=1356306 RepID=UPI0007987CA4|nr:quinolinate synthase NadA [Ferrovum sp. PN-J185]KXW56763.1 quinolinate synthase A [Ferrovum sp. PN-J185]MCC6068225.1 quinolinate synthase NadA [Ferrovum sp. PN-J185]MDE1891331.1 quinolinate synthase NadA [Betaproteobacteria bacterium]MDE2056143.1 quinolinate synthase NadA [Betaproteobacteria bacterium]
MDKQIKVDYHNPIRISTEQAWARVLEEPDQGRRLWLKDSIKKKLKEENALLVSHYYVHPDLQDLAIETGGIVADSLEMARFGKNSSASTLIVAGVKFMGETAKILSPNKTILMPDLEANCSLDLGCSLNDFINTTAHYPDHVKVVYANTSAAVKAHSDWVVTSSCAVDIVKHLRDLGKSIFWAPDKHLGNYIKEQTGADMVLWQGSCIVHDEFKAFELEQLKKELPQAKILVHPESPAAVIALADVVGSTSAILKAARELPAKEFIVATDNGMMHQLRLQNPDKIFIEAPTSGSSATCKSCAHCPWMAMNGLDNLYQCLMTRSGEIQVDESYLYKAQIPIERMLSFTSRQNTPTPGIIPGIGAA